MWFWFEVCLSGKPLDLNQFFPDGDWGMGNSDFGLQIADWGIRIGEDFKLVITEGNDK